MSKSLIWKMEFYKIDFKILFILSDVQQQQYLDGALVFSIETENLQTLRGTSIQFYVKSLRNKTMKGI